MRAKLVSSVVAGLALAAVVVATLGCGSSPPQKTAPSTAPPSAPAQPTATPGPATPTSAPPTATPLGAPARATAAPLIAVMPTVTIPSSGFGSLKPVTPTVPGQQPGVAVTPVIDTLRPTAATSTPSKSPAGPGQATPTAKPSPPSGKIRPVTKVQLRLQPTPVSTRKGVANPNVDPTKYLLEIAADLEELAAAVGELDDLMTEYQEDSITEEQLVAGFEKQAGIVRAVYDREVQRDYPPKLKEVDDYYVESLRSATKMVDALVKALQTGDARYLAEAEQHMGKFEFFMNELVKRLDS